jgi:hypothetical protein
VGLCQRRTGFPTYLGSVRLDTLMLQDVRYLKPHIEDVIKEDEERINWDNMIVERK